MSETQTVAFKLLGLDKLPGNGSLVALAVVELDVCGVVITLQGVRVVREAGKLAVRSPAFRDPRDGLWRSTTLLPPSLTQALADEMFECFNVAAA